MLIYASIHASGHAVAMRISSLSLLDSSLCNICTECWCYGEQKNHQIYPNLVGMNSLHMKWTTHNSPKVQPSLVLVENIMVSKSMHAWNIQGTPHSIHARAEVIGWFSSMPKHRKSQCHTRKLPLWNTWKSISYNAGFHLAFSTTNIVSFYGVTILDLAVRNLWHLALNLALYWNSFGVTKTKSPIFQQTPQNWKFRSAHALHTCQPSCYACTRQAQPVQRPAA